MDRVRRLKMVLWLIMGLASAVAVARYLFGLGATTNLGDATPWGLWIGFDVMSGVALAAGGFLLTATVYIFKLKDFKAFVRPAVLTAFLGYIAVVVGLLFDLGLPWNIWHMIVYWNPHSPLFEVGWCVMLYLAVLTLEFFPVPLEEFSRAAKIRNLLLKLRLPLVIAGIALSTLHQSSLGSLFLAMPYRVHPLWYSPIIPVLFFMSAICLGLMMVTFESLFTAHFYRRQPETELLGRLGKAARWFMLAYLLLRFTDLAVRGSLKYLAGAEWQVWMFWFEIAVSALVPMLLLFIRPVRTSHGGQWAIAAMGVSGVVLNRINVGGLVHLGRGGAFYLPAWTEIMISAGVVSAAVLLFMFIVERFHIWEERPADPEADPHRLPEFDRAGMAWLGVPQIAARTKYSLAFILAAAFGFALISGRMAASKGIEPTPVHRPRGGDTLWVDGNLDGYGVEFKHKFHIQKLGGNESCVRCHHMNLPRDRNSGCYACHADMYGSSDAFRHNWHASPDGGKLKCRDCHPTGVPKTGDGAVKCEVCHKDLFPSGATIRVEDYQAVSYVEAMHGLCVDCHKQKAPELDKPDMPRCATCHRERRDFVDADSIAARYLRPVGKRVVLPQPDEEREP